MKVRANSTRSSMLGLEKELVKLDYNPGTACSYTTQLQPKSSVNISSQKKIWIKNKQRLKSFLNIFSKTLSQRFHQINLSPLIEDVAVLFDWCGGYSGTTRATIIIPFVRSHVPVLGGGSEVLVAHCPGSILQISEMDPHRAKYLGITVTISSAPLTTGATQWSKHFTIQITAVWSCLRWWPMRGLSHVNSANQKPLHQ